MTGNAIDISLEVKQISALFDFAANGHRLGDVIKHRLVTGVALPIGQDSTNNQSRAAMPCR